MLLVVASSLLLGVGWTAVSRAGRGSRGRGSGDLRPTRRAVRRGRRRRAGRCVAVGKDATATVSGPGLDGPGGRGSPRLSVGRGCGIVAVSACAPGSGHLLLGRRRTGWCILGPTRCSWSRPRRWGGGLALLAHSAALPSAAHLAPRPTWVYVTVMSATGLAQLLSETTEALTWSSRSARKQAAHPAGLAVAGPPRALHDARQVRKGVRRDLVRRPVPPGRVMGCPPARPVAPAGAARPGSAATGAPGTVTLAERSGWRLWLR